MTDIVDCLIQRVRHIEPHITDEKALQLEQSLRLEFGGVVMRARKRMGRDHFRREVMKRFDGKNVNQVAAELGVHRSTIYRVLNSRPRKPVIR